MLTTCKRFDAEVVVCGGGCSGFTAALAAARAGKRTMLLEMRESLGGLFTNGYITGAAGCIDGLGKELYDRMEKDGDVTVKGATATAGNFVTVTGIATKTGVKAIEVL